MNFITYADKCFCVSEMNNNETRESKEGLELVCSCKLLANPLNDTLLFENELD